MTTEERKEYNKQYRIKNADKIRECKKKHAENNKEAYKEYHKNYRTKNRDGLLIKEKNKRH